MVIMTYRSSKDNKNYPNLNRMKKVMRERNKKIKRYYKQK